MHDLSSRTGRAVVSRCSGLPAPADGTQRRAGQPAAAAAEALRTVSVDRAVLPPSQHRAASPSRLQRDIAPAQRDRGQRERPARRRRRRGQAEPARRAPSATAPAAAPGKRAERQQQREPPGDQVISAARDGGQHRAQHRVGGDAVQLGLGRSRTRCRRVGRANAFTSSGRHVVAAAQPGPGLRDGQQRGGAARRGAQLQRRRGAGRPAQVDDVLQDRIRDADPPDRRPRRRPGPRRWRPGRRRRP